MVLNTENVDICLIAETHFTKQSFCVIENYELYHTIHPKNCARGGSAIIIKKCIKHHENFRLSTEEFQLVTVTIESNLQTLNVAALYSPPRHTIKYMQYHALLRNLGERFLVGGDFNAKNTYWGSRLTTTKGRELLKAAQFLNCNFISSGSPTYWPTDSLKIPDLIDFFIARKLNCLNTRIEEGFDMNSDHSPIFLTLGNNISEKETSPRLSTKLTDWNCFKNFLQINNESQCSLDSEDKVEEEAFKVTHIIQQAGWKSTPISAVKKFNKTFPCEIVTLLKHKWQQSRCPSDKTQLNKLSQKLKREISRFRNDTFNRYISELSYEKSTEYSLWKCTKKLKRPIIHSPAIRIDDDKWAKNDNEKAQVFAKYLQSTFTPNHGNDQIEDSMETVDSRLPEHEIPSVSQDELLREIQKLKLKKSPGFDLITAEVLKNIPNSFIKRIVKLYNACFKLKYFPSLWKVADVIMIVKPGKPPHEVSSYRPISLLPALSKLFEKLIANRLEPIIEDNNLIPSYQFGFRKKHSTIDQIHRITNIIENALEEKKVCSAVFLDVAKAFDKVWHPGLIQKLKTNLPKQFCDLLESYLEERYFRIKQNNSFSEIMQIKAGVPQGSILGPTLYLLFTNDLPTASGHCTATFADDTALLCTDSTIEKTTQVLQQAVNEVGKWANKWRISLNNTKSVHVNFTNQNIQIRPIYLFNVEIPFENKAKYLGMTLDAKLRWKEHIKIKKGELEIKFNKLKWLMGSRSQLSLNNKLMVYKQILKPVWTYGIQLWGCANKSAILLIQRFQNKVLRRVVNAPWYIRNSDLHRDLGIELVADVITKFANSHACRLERHANLEAACLVNPVRRNRRLQRTLPSDLVA